jgi:hypothetical protein
LLFKVSHDHLSNNFKDEADKLLADLPKWTSVRLIKKEIKRRFGLGDRDDLDARLNRCKDFERKWHQ